MVFVASGGSRGTVETRASAHLYLTPNAASASSNAEIMFAVTPGATLAEPSEGQVAKPGFSNTGEVILACVCVVSGCHNKAGELWDPAVPPAAFRCVSIGCFSATRRCAKAAPLPSDRWTAVRTSVIVTPALRCKWNKTVHPLFL